MARVESQNFIPHEKLQWAAHKGAMNLFRLASSVIVAMRLRSPRSFNINVLMQGISRGSEVNMIEDTVSNVFSNSATSLYSRTPMVYFPSIQPCAGRLLTSSTTCLRVRRQQATPDP